jgi:GntR family transcriptional regulator, transcriptional repressor for pyruvate dehydrogenase complex
MVEAFRPLRVKKAAEEVIAVIVDAIRGGLYEPGERLPRERDLAASLKVSRAVVREAVGVLERAGIVTVRRGTTGGIFVATRWIPQEVLEAIEGESYASMRELLETRRILETHAAVLAGAGRTDDDIEALRRLVDMLPDLMEDPVEFVAVDMRFHVRLAEASANEVLAGYVRDFMARFSTRRAQYPVGHIGLERALDNQRDTFDAIVSANPSRIAQSIDRHLADPEIHFLGHHLTVVSSTAFSEDGLAAGDGTRPA